MTCFHPIKGWAKKGDPKVTVFNRTQAYTDLPRTVPCGQCVGCRLERSRQWAIRCHHEASLYEDNCFITLTYNEEHLPKNKSLNVRVFQLFMKRLRKKYPQKIRYYACGEYGDELGRPHYHACLFNHKFPDQVVWDRRKEDILYRSEELEQLWPYGFCVIGSVTFKSAAYVARYIMKKINGPRADQHYKGRLPEFTVMSRRPGVGARWLEEYASDVYPHDFVIINGKRVRPPRYYDQNLEILDERLINRIKRERKNNLRKHADNNTPERLEVREIIQEKKLEQLKRNHDNGE